MVRPRKRNGPDAIVCAGDNLRIALVVIAGALGSLIHATTSFADYVGNRRFHSSWTAWYMVRLIVGTALALLLYFAFRGGFFSGSAQSNAVNPYGIAALAGLAGLFSKQATDKLREVFETLFRVSRIHGERFIKGTSIVRIDGQAYETVFREHTGTRRALTRRPRHRRAIARRDRPQRTAWRRRVSPAHGPVGRSGPRRATPRVAHRVRRRASAGLINLDRWEAPDFLTCEVKPHTVADARHRGDRDGDRLLTPQMTFIEQEVRYVVVTGVDEQSLHAPNGSVDGMYALAAAQLNLADGHTVASHVVGVVAPTAHERCGHA